MIGVKRSTAEEVPGLSGFWLFSYLTKQELALLDSNKIFRRYDRKSIIYEEGSSLDGFYCIINGFVKLYKSGREGKEQILRFARKGDIIGYRSMISGEQSRNTAKVVEKSVTCYIPYHTFLALMQNNWQFSRNMLQMACKELSEANNNLTSLAQKKSPELLAEALLMFKDNFKVTQSDMLQIPLTRKELAELTGTASECISRMLGKFKKEKLIKENRRKIVYMNVPGLQRIANRMNS